MPLRMPRRAGLLLKTGQTTSYSSEQDDGALQKGLAKSYTVLSDGAQSGTTNVDLTHYSGTDVAFDAGTKEIRATGKCGVFKAAGGETIVVSGSVANNGVFTSVSATADKVVVTEAVTDEAAGATVVLAKREAKSNNCVQDNNTGLMWSRYESDKMGTAGGGVMPFTGVDYDMFAYVAACNAAEVGGHSDWYVSDWTELMSIIIQEAPAYSVDAAAFPSVAATFATKGIGSSTTVPGTTTKARGFFSGGEFDYTKSAGYAILLVRGG